MYKISVVIISEADAKAGKEVHPGATPENTREAMDVTFGVHEGGMASGKTSVTVWLQDAAGNYVAGSFSARQLEMLHGAVKGARERFNDTQD